MNERVLEVSLAAIGIASGLIGIFFPPHEEVGTPKRRLRPAAWYLAVLLLAAVGFGLYRSLVNRTQLEADNEELRQARNKLQNQVDRISTNVDGISPKLDDVEQSQVFRGKFPHSSFEVVIETGKYEGSKLDAGTDQPVYVRVKGKRWKHEGLQSSPWLRLNAAGDDFEEDATNQFVVETLAFTDLSMVEVKWSGGDGDAAWVLKSLRLMDLKHDGIRYEAELGGSPHVFRRKDKERIRPFALSCTDSSSKK